MRLAKMLAITSYGSPTRPAVPEPEGAYLGERRPRDRYGVDLTESGNRPDEALGRHHLEEEPAHDPPRASRSLFRLPKSSPASDRSS
jgi:hypothetical protein